MIQKLIENISTVDLKNLISENSANRIFLITGKGSYEHSGAKEFIETSLNGIDFVHFSEFEQNPKYEDAVIGTRIFQESKSDMIIAIGGGSVIDMAKLINTFAANSEEEALAIVKDSKRISVKGKFMVAIPTTAGTGSEATHFAVVYHERRKYSVAHQSLLPNAVGLNVMFTMSQSKYLTACTGLDALSQAIESFWSVGGTQESKKYAEEAIRLLVKNLVNAVNSPNRENHISIVKGAYMAGKAINISKTTAAHAVSYAFTTYYSVPHGHAIFLTLPEFFEYNYGVSEKDVNDLRGVEYVKRNIEDLCGFFGVESASEGKHFLTNIAKGIGVELSLEKLGIKNYREIIVNNVNLERLGNNPRKIDKEALIELLKNRVE